MKSFFKLVASVLAISGAGVFVWYCSRAYIAADATESSSIPELQRALAIAPDSAGL
ncbi:MAG: hypothetical protein JO041_12140, partial [Acidobacteria bacterium]|nr:hypothetical protein [Acidobacteriota bacterium]